jgi:hypothetical protein
MFLWAQRLKKNKKNFFLNYFLLFLVAKIVIIALYTKKTLLILFAVESTKSVLKLIHSFNWMAYSINFYFRFTGTWHKAPFPVLDRH